MRTLFTFLILGLLVSGFGPAANTKKGTITLQTAKGPYAYTANKLPIQLDVERQTLSFRFKIPYFSSGNEAQDQVLYKVLQAESYGEITYAGLVEKKFSTLKPGQMLQTAANGSLTFAGKEVQARIPITIHKTKTGFVHALTATIDLAKDETTAQRAKELGVTGPLVISINHE
jgi:hypothetical protein